MKEKPITLKIEDLKQNIATIMNESELPINYIEIALKELKNEIREQILNQLIEDIRKYESSLKEKYNQ